MVQRVAYGAFVIAVLVLLFSADALIADWAAGTDARLVAAMGPPPTGVLTDLLRHGSVVPLVFLCLIVAGAAELNRLLRAAGANPHSAFALLATSVLFLSPWLSAGGVLGSSVEAREGLFWPLTILAASVLGAGVLQVLRLDPRGAIRDSSATLLIVFYMGFLASFGLMLRSAVDGPDPAGPWLLLISILIIKCSDIGAYFVGSALGRHKLCPTISPAKSVEGMLGGLAGSALASVFFVSLVGLASRLGAGETTLAALGRIVGSFSLPATPGGIDPLVRAAVFGITVSVSAQFGDLLESCFKRDAGIKDSGRFIPQYGGILDLLDSPVFALPVAWCLLTAFWPRA